MCVCVCVCVCLYVCIYMYNLLVNNLSVILFLNELELISLNIIKYCYCLFESNGFKYSYQTIIILFNITN